MPLDPRREIESTLKVARSLRAAEATLRRIPVIAANYYANGGAGVGQAVVGDRFQGKGNSRFAPLSAAYRDRKIGVSKDMNKQQKAVFGRGSRMIKVSVGQRFKGIQPILVLSGKLRESVTSRTHSISIANGSDTAFVTFHGLPIYAAYHHAPVTAPFPKRSPVEPNTADMVRVHDFIAREISKLTARFNNGPVAFGGAQARIIV